MAARAIVAERQALALIKIREQAAALSESLGVDASALTETVKGDAAYQEMVRSEQLAELLGAVREKVGSSGEAKLLAAKQSDSGASKEPAAQTPPETPNAPQNEASGDPQASDAHSSRKATKPSGRSHK